MRRTNARTLFFFALGLFAIPVISFARITITEVMYDAPGSDSGHEWIEIANTGDIANIAGYKLSEGGTNHGITVVSGTSTLAAGKIAVIANNPQNFLEDFPGFSDALFKSAFSLSNTGETITIKDSSLKPVDSVTYTSALGASGDGNTIHLNEGSWVPGAPNPGSLAPSAALKSSLASPAKKGITKKSSTPAITISPDEPAAVGALSMQPPPQPGTLWIYLLGLGALVVAAVAGAVYVKSNTPARQETAPSAGEFDIVE